MTCSLVNGAEHRGKSGIIPGKRLPPGRTADAAIEAADVVFMNSSMECVPQALNIAREATSISWQNVVFALVVKALVMILGLFGIASMWMAVFADTGVAILCVLPHSHASTVFFDTPIYDANTL